ncbi:hypothetical protein Tco_1163137 [Tanacetum coccineum]
MATDEKNDQRCEGRKVNQSDQNQSTVGTNSSSSLTSPVLAIGSGMIKPLSNKCPNRNLNAYVGENHEGETRIDFGDDLENIDEFAQVEGEVVSLMVQRTLGSYETIVSKELVKELKLPTEQHANPYKLGWIKKGPMVKVKEVCKIPIAIENFYRDVVSCHVVDLGASHVLSR